jgi:hypothetical protein
MTGSARFQPATDGGSSERPSSPLASHVTGSCVADTAGGGPPMPSPALAPDRRKPSQSVRTMAAFWHREWRRSCIFLCRTQSPPSPRFWAVSTQDALSAEVLVSDFHWKSSTPSPAAPPYDRRRYTLPGGAVVPRRLPGWGRRSRTCQVFMGASAPYEDASRQWAWLRRLSRRCPPPVLNRVINGHNEVNDVRHERLDPSRDK